MTAQRLITGFAAIGLIFVAALLTIIITGLQFATLSGQRIEGARDRAAIILELVGDSHHYAEQVAAVLLFGKGQADELGSARVDMERAFSRLNQATRQSISALGAVGEVENELPEVDTNRRMLELYHAIDMSASRALTQQRDGKLPEAAQLFQNEVQFRLSNELLPLLDSALMDEQQEAATERASFAGLRTGLLIGGSLVALLAALSLVASAVLLRRSIERPVEQLRTAMAAMAAGHAQQQISMSGDDKFAFLARSFNEMAHAVAVQQDDLRAAGEQLRAEMDTRTRQWQEANDTLRAVDERRSQFLADVSHQLRTPLTILRGEADVALRGRRRQQDLRQALDRIQAQAAELGQLLEDLISYARSDAESHGHEPAAVRIDDVVNAAVAEGQALAEPREINVVAALDDYGSVVHADMRRLKQALVIGLDNAVKHTAPGGRIDVATELDSRVVRIRILDEGPGIDPDEEHRVFERFFRGRIEGELLNQGLGIGLAIAKEIVERHGGTISLHNREGGGAVLEITLPIIDSPIP